MRIPPVRVRGIAPATANFSGTAAVTSVPGQNFNQGDIITFYGSIANSTVASNVFPSSSAGASISWVVTNILESTDQTQSGMYAWYGSVQANLTNVTITGTREGNNYEWGWYATVWSGSDGVDNSDGSLGESVARLAIGAQPRSAITGQANDWNAVNGASRVLFPGNTEALYYSNPGVTHTVYGAYIADVGAGGNVTWGYSAPSGQRAAVALMEVMGTTVPDTQLPGLLTETGLNLRTESGSRILL